MPQFSFAPNRLAFVFGGRPVRPGLPARCRAPRCKLREDPAPRPVGQRVLAVPVVLAPSPPASAVAARGPHGRRRNAGWQRRSRSSADSRDRCSAAADGWRSAPRGRSCPGERCSGAQPGWYRAWPAGAARRLPWRRPVPRRGSRHRLPPSRRRRGSARSRRRSAGRGATGLPARPRQGPCPSGVSSCYGIERFIGSAAGPFKRSTNDSLRVSHRPLVVEGISSPG